MRTSEFIKQVNAMGYTTHIDEPSKLLYITDEGLYLAVISLIEQYRFDLAFETKKEMYDLYSLIGVYIRTPINDRDEPAKKTYRFTFTAHQERDYEAHSKEEAFEMAKAEWKEELHSKGYFGGVHFEEVVEE